LRIGNMRLHGTLERWQDDKGYGFIAPTGGGAPVFVHVSEFPLGMRRPTQGEAVTYAVGRGKDGRPCAVTARWERSGTTPMPVACDPARGPRRSRDARDSPRRGNSSRAVGLLALVLLAALAYAVSSGRFDRAALPSNGMSTPAAVSEEPIEPLDLTPPRREFRCDERKHCSEMTSCEEARYFLDNCSGVKMDGDDDGDPCERGPC
jgi:cold shock CspA family protein